ncbi:hypothetical protein [Nostoc sp. MG11]|uniref:hypothetical protein n=1 Tax=Nostoc sp. MG11 TaxID=2721166 RepID=UPI001868ACE2|nr:hypothetical protein [Nostoc sp. MG11]
MAARSFNLTLRNVTNLTLHRKNVNLMHGEFSGSGNAVPPENIAPMTRATWQSESDGFATGTEGTVTYGSEVGDFFIHWNNPFVGSNGLGVAVPTGFSYVFGDISGNDANVAITISPNV